MLISRLVQPKFALFGLPVTLAGAILPFAIMTRWPHWSLWLWIVAAFLTARTAGMAFNQLIDRQIDARNPRTADRLLPSGEAKPLQVLLLASTALALFLFCCAQIGMFYLGLLPAALIILYSYAKRFTSLCHLLLGFIQFCGPVYAWIAITGSLAVAPLFLGAALWCWIAANDILYALQDLEFDRAEGLHSLPTRIGPRAALVVIRSLHGLALFCLLAVGVSLSLSMIYYAGVLAVAILFVKRASWALSNQLAATAVFLAILGAVLWANMF